MRNKTVQNIALYAMLIAIIAVMTLIPNVGYITVAGISFTTLHVVVLVFAWAFDWKKATMAGLLFGLLCMWKAFAMPTSVTDPWFQNPLVSVLPRLLYGLIAGLTFKLTNRIQKNSTRLVVNLILCAVLTLVHTVLVLSMLYLFHQSDLQGQLFTLIFALNLPIEMGIAVVVGGAISLALLKAFPKEVKGEKEAMKSKYEQLLEQFKPQLLDDLSKLIAINSVYDETTADENNPFGKGVSKALEYVNQMAKRDGFQSRNIKNMVTEIVVGSGNKNITIMAHADVVPEGTGWDQNPFELVEKDGVLCGRGVADDKGPLLASYYALRCLRDNNLLGKYKVRFLVGGNEETGSRGIEYYFSQKENEQPTLGFSPDAEFPLIFGEKGIMNFEVKKEFNNTHVFSLVGGVAFNSVIEKCVVECENDKGLLEFLNKNNVKYVVLEDSETIKLQFIGVAAHGATPECGVNAGMIAIKMLGQYFNIEEFKQIDRCFSDLYGAGLNAFSHSDDMGLNSLNVGIINYQNNQFELVANFRFVDTADYKQLENNIVEACKPFEATRVSFAPLLFYPKDSVLVSTLMKAYQEETGDMKSKPMAIGGGTYAKEADNIVAFGMEMPGWDSKMHSPGEAVRKEDLFKGMSIYANAIVALGEKLNEN